MTAAGSIGRGTAMRGVGLLQLALATSFWALCSGCSADSLKWQTINQALLTTDMRYRQVLNDLSRRRAQRWRAAVVRAHRRWAANVTRTVSIESATLFDQAVNGFSKETLTVLAQHNPELQWTLDPVASSPQLEALGYACLWALKGPPSEGSRAMELLREPRISDLYACSGPGEARPRPSYHLDVAKQLAAMPPCWLRVSRGGHAPHRAVYSATCGNTTVWVEPEGLAGLSEFTLVVLDIATINPRSLVIPTPLVSVSITEKAPINQPDGDDIANSELPVVSAVKDPKSNTTTVTVNKILKGDKITELWYVCQDSDGGSIGTINLTRPKAFKFPTSATPMIPNSVPTSQRQPTQLIIPIIPNFRALSQ